MDADYKHKNGSWVGKKRNEIRKTNKKKKSRSSSGAALILMTFIKNNPATLPA